MKVNSLEVSQASAASAGRGFIVGAPRSGTTLLMNLVAADPQIAPVYETGYVRNLLALCEQVSGIEPRGWGRRVLSRLNVFGDGDKNAAREYCAKVLAHYRPSSRSKQGKTKDEHFLFGNLCIEYNFCELVRETERFVVALTTGDGRTADPFALARVYVDRLFAIHCARMSRPYWVNKTPSLARCLNLLRKMYPECPIIHIVRDGRDVTLSTVSVRNGPNNVRDAARRWKDMVLSCRRLQDQRGYLEIRYEDLIAEPQRTMARVFAALGFGKNTAVMPPEMEIYRHREKVWRAGLSKKEKIIFAKEAGDLLISLGYEKDDAWVE
jgi:Sulfotransferase family